MNNNTQKQQQKPAQGASSKPRGNEKVFYIPGEKFIVDLAFEVNPGVYKSAYGRKTLAEMEQEFPGVVLMDEHEVVETINRLCRTDPVEITEERFFVLLEVLPPLRWGRNHDSESFKMSEFTNGSITLNVVRLGDRYFCFEDDYRLTHEEACAKCKPLLG
ncbi:hypothetical protein ABZR11_29185 [Pseudomonas aeruginosa]